MMLLNFFEDEHLQTGKSIIDKVLSTHTSNYLTNFCQVRFEPPTVSTPPTKEDYSVLTRYKRQVFVYRALLAKAGFSTPTNIPPDTGSLFNDKLVGKVEKNQTLKPGAMDDYDGPNAAQYKSSAKVLRSHNPQEEHPSWGQVAVAIGSLADFMIEKNSGYKEFEEEYVRTSSSGDLWADETLKKLLEMFRYHNGSSLIGAAKPQHTPHSKTDYAADIYNDLVDGKLVIVDQSSGEPELNKSSTDRIMWQIFREQQKKFREGKTPEDIIVYAEEAHNLLPAGSDLDLKDVWVRTAKEGAKYHIGLVYATQEVSSIQRNILKNTANWFIGHLNNSDETRELCKFYDFADFEPSIRRAQDKGFLRVKTLSNLFVLPVQVRLFRIESVASTAVNKGMGEH